MAAMGSDGAAVSMRMPPGCSRNMTKASTGPTIRARPPIRSNDILHMSILLSLYSARCSVKSPERDTPSAPVESLRPSARPPRPSGFLPSQE